MSDNVEIFVYFHLVGTHQLMLLPSSAATTEYRNHLDYSNVDYVYFEVKEKVWFPVCKNRYL